MEDGILYNLKFAQFTHELDIAEHFSFGHIFGVLFIRIKAAGNGGHFFVLLWDLGAIFKLISTLFEQQLLESARNWVLWFEIWSFFNEEFAQLCIHRRIFRLIEGFFENLKEKRRFTWILRKISKEDPLLKTKCIFLLTLKSLLLWTIIQFQTSVIVNVNNNFLLIKKVYIVGTRYHMYNYIDTMQLTN